VKAPRLIAPLAAAAALCAASPAAQADPLRAGAAGASQGAAQRPSAAGAPDALRSIAEPMQFPGDASASAIRSAPGTWLLGARPGRGARTVARAFGARLIGGGDYVVARDRARAMAGALRSRGLLVYAQPDALRRTKQAVADDPLSKSPDAWRAAVADPNIPPPLVTETSPLPPRELADVAGGDGTELEQRLTVEHHLGAWLAGKQRREVSQVYHAAVRTIRSTGMFGQPLRVTPDDDPLAVHADRDRRTHLGDRY